MPTDHRDVVIVLEGPSVAFREWKELQAVNEKKEEE